MIEYSTRDYTSMIQTCWGIKRLLTITLYKRKIRKINGDQHLQGMLNEEEKTWLIPTISKFYIMKNTG